MGLFDTGFMVKKVLHDFACKIYALFYMLVWYNNRIISLLVQWANSVILQGICTNSVSAFGYKPKQIKILIPNHKAYIGFTYT